MFCWCNDIWITVKEIFCCRSYDPPTIGHYMNGNKGMPGAPGVITLVATAEGLQLKLPAPAHQPSSQNLIPASNCPAPSTYNFGQLPLRCLFTGEYLGNESIQNTESSVSVSKSPENDNSYLEPELLKTNKRSSKVKKTRKKPSKPGTSKELSQKTTVVANKSKVPPNAGGIKRRPAPKATRTPIWK
uniref:GAGA-binding transcriptional activator n=1 Tax=Heterorhabditis bacteriophora TaxID=37862 RepID=A0A1I7XMY2_HETBA